MEENLHLESAPSAHGMYIKDLFQALPDSQRHLLNYCPAPALSYCSQYYLFVCLLDLHPAIPGDENSLIHTKNVRKCWGNVITWLICGCFRICCMSSPFRVN